MLRLLSGLLICAFLGSAPLAGNVLGDENLLAPRLADLGGCCIGFEKGDMNLDELINVNDVEPFALGLISPIEYLNTYGISPHISGDMDGDNDLDVDDIDDFAEILGDSINMSLAQVSLRINKVAVPEPSVLMLTVMPVSLIILVSFRPRQSHKAFIK